MKIASKIRDLKIRCQKSCNGFTLIEIMIAVVLLTLVSVGLLGLFSNTLLMVKYSQDDLIARQKAQQALEMILSAKTTGQLTFDSPDNLENVGVGNGSFTSGWQPLLIAGPDGLMGTADDGCVSSGASCTGGTIADSYIMPGSNGVLANTAYGASGQAVPAGASVIPLTNFQRQIVIGSATMSAMGSVGSGFLRSVTVTVRYPMHPNGFRTYTVVSYVSSFQ